VIRRYPSYDESIVDKEEYRMPRVATADVAIEIENQLRGFVQPPNSRATGCGVYSIAIHCKSPLELIRRDKRNVNGMAMHAARRCHYVSPTRDKKGNLVQPIGRKDLCPHHVTWHRGFKHYDAKVICGNVSVVLGGAYVDLVLVVSAKKLVYLPGLVSTVISGDGQSMPRRDKYATESGRRSRNRRIARLPINPAAGIIANRIVVDVTGE
jgi:hypothetical protein